MTEPSHVAYPAAHMGAEVTRLTTTQRFLIVALFLFVALTRVASLAPALWDWDEALFTLGVRSYDVTQHHPHPPGYPGFIAAAKAMHAVGFAEFSSLQAVVCLAAILLWPLTFALARACHLPVATAVLAATLFVFLPNVWVYGGMALSDVPAVAISIAAVTALLRARSDIRFLYVGWILIGLACTIRPLAVLLAIAPTCSLLLSSPRSRRVLHLIRAGLVAFVIIGAAYGLAAHHSGGLQQYRGALQRQAAWVRGVDSFQNPTRPSLATAARIVFTQPVSGTFVFPVLAILAAVSLGSQLRPGHRSSHLLTVSAAFAPVALVTWLSLDITSVSRYAIAFLPAYALLAAHGAAVIGRWCRHRRTVELALTGGLCVVAALWTLPAIKSQRSAPSPPAAALAYARTVADAGTPIYVDNQLRPHAQTLLEDRRIYFVENEASIGDHGPGPVVMHHLTDGGTNVARPRGRLWNIVRQANFEASVTDTRTLRVFVSGFYDLESDGEATWRWMSRSGQVILPQLRGTGRLRLRMQVPLDVLASAPTLEIRWNDRVVEKVHLEHPTFDREYVLHSAEGRNTLVLTTDQTVNPAARGLSADERDLGLRIDTMTWTPAGDRRADQQAP